MQNVHILTTGQPILMVMDALTIMIIQSLVDVVTMTTLCQTQSVVPVIKVSKIVTKLAS